MDIAVGALSGMVDSLPGKLGDLLQQEYTLLSGVRGDVGFLQSELGTMNAALLRCESLDNPDIQTRAWVAQVRDLAYDIEDWIDLFAHRVDGGADSPAAASAAAKSSSGFLTWVRCCVNKVTTLPARHIIATTLQELKTRVVELSEQRKRYRFDPPAARGGVAGGVDPRLVALYADAGSLVGMDTPVEEVSEMVVDSGKAALKCVAISGMPGSGKTTLATAVHRRLKEQKRFDCSAFVSVGQKPDIAGKTLKGILSQIGGGYGGGEDISRLIGMVRDELKDKRYLIVIDDLWTRTEWPTLRCCFPDENLGSRIIVTTRNDVLAKECSSNSGDCVYKLGLLNDVHSRDLFFSKAFGKGNDCPSHLKDLSPQVIERCGGLPLALASIAGALAHRFPKDEWERYASNLLTSSYSDGQNLKQILNLSYNDLPSHLKSCMLYLSIFPNNYEIDVEHLVRRWIAEGFVADTRYTSKEERARSYLTDLISRNMIPTLHLRHDGTPRCCKLHPVIHDFIVVKSMEENFVTLVDAKLEATSTNNGTVRRLSIQNSVKQDKIAAQNDDMIKHARSLTVFGHGSGVPRLNDMSVLRVLDLGGCNGPVCLDGLCKLILLRYLSLRGTDVSELPAQIGELRCLETLDVRSTKVKELPASIVRLENLMHLLGGNAKLPGEIKKMKALLTLSCADVGKNTVSVLQELGELGNLRELELFCDATENAADKKRVSFPSNGFKGVRQLCIQSSLPSVTFVNSSLRKVEVLELKFEKGLSDGSTSVSGIEHLHNLKHVVIEFSQDDAGAIATIASVKKAAETLHPNHPDVFDKINRRNN
uniref:AAA+ ATPase domain-containing protein n=1 Tax=Leersia perrieri TaxID=77586 RepID=A0A0D9V0G6_9ORYZ